jgi:hypothetical protein
MDKHEKQLETTLREMGAVLVRTKRHNVYRFPDGRTYAQPQSSSDWRSTRNALGDLRHLLRTALPGEVDSEEPDHAEEPQNGHSRFVVPNQPARERAPIVLPVLESTPSAPLPTSDIVRFNNPVKLDFLLQDMPEFWQLSPCGRTRVLLKALGPVLPVEPISVMFGYVNAAAEYVQRPGESAADYKARCRENAKTILRRIMDGDRCYPTLLWDAADEAMIIDACAMSETGRGQHLLFGLATLHNQPEGTLVMAGGTVPDDKDGLILLSGFRPRSGYQSRMMHFVPDEQWTNPKATRAVFRQLCQRWRETPDEDFLTPPATPVEATT